MPNTRDRGAARAEAKPFRRKPLAGATITSATGGAAVCRTKGARQADNDSRTSRDAELLALLVTLKQQSGVIAEPEKQGHVLPEGSTEASGVHERRMGETVVRRGKIMDPIIATPASTPAALRATAKTLALVALADAFGDEGETLEELTRSEYKDGREQLALSLARDVLAWRVTV